MRCHECLICLSFLEKSGTCTGVFSYLNQERVNNITINTDLAFVEKKLGLQFLANVPKIFLFGPGFDVSFAGDEFSVRVPSWRATKDISIKEDLVEEIDV